MFMMLYTIFLLYFYCNTQTTISSERYFSITLHRALGNKMTGLLPNILLSILSYPQKRICLSWTLMSYSLIDEKFCSTLYVISGGSMRLGINGPV